MSTCYRLKGSQRTVGSGLWYCAVVIASLWLGGCQSTRELMQAEGYPPAFIDGFEAGCSSGRQAAGGLASFRKDVARYLAKPQYAQGWDDGFHQCQAMQQSAWAREWHDESVRDREWRRHVEQSMAQALRSKSGD